MLSKYKFGELKDEENRGDNVIHFQDPRSAKFNGTLQRPLTKTKNERNYTSYNFIRQEWNSKQEQKFVRKTPVEKYRKPTQVKGLIQQ